MMRIRTGQCKLFLTIFLIQATIGLKAQDIKLIHHRTQEKVLLRWAPTSAADWYISRQTGVMVERITVTRDSTRVFPVKIKTLVKRLVPIPLEGWEEAYLTNKYAALAAQALYGESFSVNLNKEGSSPFDFINQAEDLESRFSYLLMACDYSFPVAKMAGLAIEDTTVMKDESYLYKIYIAGGVEPSDTTYLFASTEESKPLPAIKDLQANFTDSGVELSWPVEPYNHFFTSYNLEVSYNGRDFFSLDSLISVQTFSPESSSKRFVRLIKLADREQGYIFRVSGISAFGMKGPPGPVVSGKLKKPFRLNIYLSEEKLSTDRISLKLNMGVNKGLEELQVVSTNLLKSIDGEVFRKISSFDGLQTSFADSLPDNSSYYKAQILDMGDKIFETVPILVQLPDSIPPAIPVGLNGFCDSLGNVHLEWQKNNEKDLEGYRLYRSRIENGEYRRITKSAISDSLFIDSIGLDIPANHYFYKVQAVDNRYNRSELSEPAEVVTVDRLPPVSPRIVGYEVQDGVVKIEWVPSTSADVTRTFLYREWEGVLDSVKIFSAGGSPTTYYDTIQSTLGVRFYLRAIDRNNSGSLLSNAILVTAKATQAMRKFQVNIEANRQKKYILLSWIDETNFSRISIYRKHYDPTYSLIGCLENETNTFIDREIELNNHYFYLVIAVSSSGTCYITELSQLF